MWASAEVCVGERTLVAEGAAASAPTAPHATPPHCVEDERTGPARFWSASRVRIGLTLGFLVSGAFHYVISPFSMLPSGPPLEFHEQQGELSIPVDLVGEGTGDKPQNTPKDNGNGGVAGAGDGGRDAEGDGGADASTDDAASEEEAGAGIALADAGVGRDPQSILGAAASVSAGPNNITLIVNFVELRKHPEAARLGLVLGGIPQWRAFMSNAQGAAMLDPMRDADWMLIMGPSFLETQNDAVFVHYQTPDPVVDKLIDTVSRRYDKGGPVDVGVRGVKAWKGFADRGERVFLRPRPHIAVIVPPSKAKDFARVLASSPITPHMRAGEAMSLRALHPGGSIPVLPQDISEMRLWIVPRDSDGGGDLYIEGDCPSDAEASVDAATLKTFIAQKNSFAVRLLTAGFFNNVEVTAAGPQVHVHISATEEQIDALLALVAGRVGVTLPPPTHAAGLPAPATSALNPAP